MSEEKSTYEKFAALNVNDRTEKKNGLTYLSWAWAWSEFLKLCPKATYEIIKTPEGLPYFADKTGACVFTVVTADGISREMWLPVMDGANKAMRTEPITYLDKYKKEKTIAAYTMFDINKTIMRCLTKNLAMFGLGLYIYAGEDIPHEEGEGEKQYVNKHEDAGPEQKKIYDAVLVAIERSDTMDEIDRVAKRAEGIWGKWPDEWQNTINAEVTKREKHLNNKHDSTGGGQ